MLTQPRINSTEAWDLVLEMLLDHGNVDLPIHLAIVNPFQVNITITAVVGEVLFNDSVVGLVNVGNIRLPVGVCPRVLVGPNSTTLTQEIFMALNYFNDTSQQQKDVFTAFFELLKNNLTEVNLVANVTFQIGETPMVPTVLYGESGIPLFWSQNYSAPSPAVGG